MSISTSVKDYMKVKLRTVDAGTSTLNAYLLMTEHHLRHLPVVKEGKLVGMLSDRDILKALGTSPGKFQTAEEAMDSNPYSVFPEADLKEILPVMIERKVDSVLVKERDESLTGIFTSTDAFRILLSVLEQIA